MTSQKDPYQVLGVSRQATDQEIRQAYRSLVKKYHPDQYADPTMKGLAQEKLVEINQANDLIGDPEKRRAYDLRGPWQQGRAGGPYGSNPYGPFGPFGPFGQQGQSQGGPAGPDAQGSYRHNPYGPGRQQNPWGGTYYGGQFGGCCDQLTCLCCADSCCECLGGDLCTCC